MRPLISLLKPEKTELLIYPVLGFLLLIISNSKRFWEFFATGIDSDNIQAESDVAYGIQNYLFSIESAIDPRLVDFTVWAAIGVISVIVIVATQHIIQEADEERQYAAVIRDTRTRRHQIKDYVLRVIVRFCGVVFLFLWLRIFLGGIFSKLTQVFYESVIAPFSITTIPKQLLASAACGLGLYGIVVCVRLIALKTRVLTH